jgi:hypothetical protein
MIGIEFMTGAMLLSALKMVFTLVFIWVLYRVGRKFYVFATDTSHEKTINLKWELAYIFGVVIISIFMGPAAQPKLTLEVPPNRELIEYQSGEDVVIETPEPRTEKLEGFTPLKKD